MKRATRPPHGHYENHYRQLTLCDERGWVQPENGRSRDKVHADRGGKHLSFGGGLPGDPLSSSGACFKGMS